MPLSENKSDAEEFCWHENLPQPDGATHEYVLLLVAIKLEFYSFKDIYIVSHANVAATTLEMINTCCYVVGLSGFLASTLSLVQTLHAKV